VLSRGDVVVVFGVVEIASVELLVTKVVTPPLVLASCTEVDVEGAPRDCDAVVCDKGVCRELVPDV